MAQIFFRNTTVYNFELYDTDNNHYGTVRANSSYSFSLPFSETFQKGYKLITTLAPLITITFSMTINGLFSEQVSVNPSLLNVLLTKHNCRCPGTAVVDLNQMILYTGAVIPPPERPVVVITNTQDFLF